MTEPYEVDLTATARRALGEKLPLDVAMGVSDFVVGLVKSIGHCRDIYCV